MKFVLQLPASDGDILACQACGELIEIVQRKPLVVDIPEDPLISSRRILIRQQY
jgi:hypothetical protein